MKKETRSGEKEEEEQSLIKNQILVHQMISFGESEAGSGGKEKE
jgi:hypothetical protein